MEPVFSSFKCRFTAVIRAKSTADSKTAAQVRLLQSAVMV